MKNLLAIAALASLMSMPMLGNAQDHDRNGQDRNQQKHRQDDQRKQDEARRQQERQRSEQQRRISQMRNRHDMASSHRQDTKNEWRNIAIGAGGIGVLGLLTHDNTLTFAGAAGALYSLNRYEQDRKSQSSQDRLRSEYFSRDHFNRDGHRYDRKTITRNGQRYYQFVRGH